MASSIPWSRHFPLSGQLSGPLARPGSGKGSSNPQCWAGPASVGTALLSPPFWFSLPPSPEVEAHTHSSSQGPLQPQGGRKAVPLPGHRTGDSIRVLGFSLCLSHEDSKAQEVTVLPKVGSEAMPARGLDAGLLILPAPCPFMIQEQV